MLHGLLIKGVAGTLTALTLLSGGAAGAAVLASGHGTAAQTCDGGRPLVGMAAVHPMAGTSHDASSAPARGMVMDRCGVGR